jgi:hypothetical protein
VCIHEYIFRDSGTSKEEMVLIINTYFDTIHVRINRMEWIYLICFNGME